jgi:hypothetical protein
MNPLLVGVPETNAAGSPTRPAFQFVFAAATAILNLANGPPRPGPASAMTFSGDCVASRNYRSAGIKCLEMIRVVLTDAAYDAIASTLPKGAARWPMQRDRDQCFIQVEAAVVDRMRAIRRPGESYSEVMLRLVELKTSDLK